ncbi:MAG: dUTP diphosphatase [Erysipelotrichales bacterium]|nr:dUTP diphosphatase [Erysipelotrichales bacterium]
MISMINEMAEMQKKLDAAILAEFKNVEFDKARWKIAILAEIGELTQEIKGGWCWWMKHPKEIHRDKVLEELVDVWHFVLSYHNNVYPTKVYDIIYERHVERCYPSYIEVVTLLLEFPSLEAMVVLSSHLGFEIKDVYDAYIKKNKVNYERLSNQY